MVPTPLLLGLCLLGACASDSTVLVIAVSGLPPQVSALRVAGALDGERFADPQEFAGAAAQIGLRLPADRRGRLRLVLQGLDDSGCVAARGAGAVILDGQPRIDLPIALHETSGTLQVALGGGPVAAAAAAGERVADPLGEDPFFQRPHDRHLSVSAGQTAGDHALATGDVAIRPDGYAVAIAGQVLAQGAATAALSLADVEVEVCDPVRPGQRYALRFACSGEGSREGRGNGYALARSAGRRHCESSGTGAVDGGDGATIDVTAGPDGIARFPPFTLEIVADSDGGHSSFAGDASAAITLIE